MGKRAGSRHILTYRKNVRKAELAFLFCGKIDSKMGLFWGPPAFENRDFLVILTHFVHLLGLLSRRIDILT
jgi:hypothetical protein